MSDAPQLILHVGAPKCGSSALQVALSQTPDLVDRHGRQLRYTCWRELGTGTGLGSVSYGRDVTRLARASAYGYVSWPNIPADTVEAPMFAALDQVRRRGLRRGHVPIASCEGWINRAGAFARQLEAWGHPPVEVVAFLRPVIDWYNSAFWQWGIWQLPSLDAWMNRANMAYSFGTDLEDWARIPNVRVRFAWSQPDAVAQFAAWQGVALAAERASNLSSSPPLIGVLLRHRRLRPDGHDAATEFVVQRWCPPVAGRGLWAVMARHVHRLRPVMRDNRAALGRIASDEGMQAVCDDRRWVEEQVYHDRIRAGVSPLNDPDQLAALHGALAAGLARLAVARGRPAPEVPDCPPPEAEIRDWDAALVAMLEALVDGDTAWRAAPRRTLGGVRLRLGEALLRARDQLVSRSRW